LCHFHIRQQNETQMNKAQSFTPVLDGRKRKVRGLWHRGNRFYGRLKIAFPGEDAPKVRRVPLKAITVAAANKELRELHVSRDKGKRITRERTPTLAEYGQQYIDRLYAGSRKRPRTISSESGHVNFWTRELGRHRLHSITAGQIRWKDACSVAGVNGGYS